MGKMDTINPLGALERAIEIAGGTDAALARKISAISPRAASREAVGQWRRKGRAPTERCHEIETIVGGQVTKYQLRPDVFGPAPLAPTEAAA